MYGRYVCPKCGCYLDPGERCDCQEETKRKIAKEKEHRDNIEKMLLVSKDGQIQMVV